jgi:hypothetical protein
MHLSFGGIVLLSGLFLVIASQVGIALHAFSTGLIEGLACLFVPFYAYMHARRNKAVAMLMRAWFAGIALWVAGGIAVS